MLRIAIIGAGWAGQRQLEASRELGSKIEVTCLMDTDEDFLLAKAAELRVEKTSTDFVEVLEDAEIDAVSICTPHAYHCNQAVAAAEAGKHVLVEKPMALNVADATKMIRAAAKARVRLYVAESEVYTPIVLWLSEAVRTGKYTGEIVAASYCYGFRAEVFRYPGRREWLTRPELGGAGTWMLHGIHSMAKVRAVFGEVKTVYLREHHANDFATPEIEGTVNGLLTMESGFSLSILQSCETKVPGAWNGFDLFGTRGLVRAAAEGYELFAKTAGDYRQQPLRPYPEPGLSSYAQELDAFADYVLEGIPGPTSGESERRTLAVVEAGYKSMASGAPVPLSRFGSI